MRCIYVLLSMVLVLLMSSVVSANPAYEASDIYAGFAPYGENFTAGGHTFIITGSSTLDPFMLNLPDGEALTFSEAGCLSEGLFMACYNGSKELDWRNYTLDKSYYKPYINITEYIAISQEIVITKTLDYEGDAQIQNPIEVRVKLYNNATANAKGIVLKDSIPAGFEISDMYGCEIVGMTNIRWYGELGTKKTHLCRYTMTPIEPVTFTTKATVDYILEDQALTAESGVLELEVTAALLGIIQNLSKENYTIGESVTYSLNMTNLDDAADLDIKKLLIKLPPELTFVKHHHKLHTERQGIIYEGILDPLENESIWVMAEASKVGNVSIETEVAYRIGGVDTEATLRKDLEIMAVSISENMTYDNVTENGTVGANGNLSLNETFNETFNGTLNESLENLTENASGAAEPAAAPIVTHLEESKKKISNTVVFMIVGGVIVMIGVLFYIKKRRQAYY